PVSAGPAPGGPEPRPGRAVVARRLGPDGRAAGRAADAGAGHARVAAAAAAGGLPAAFPAEADDLRRPGPPGRPDGPGEPVRDAPPRRPVRPAQLLRPRTLAAAGVAVCLHPLRRRPASVPGGAVRPEPVQDRARRDPAALPPRGGARLDHR